MQFAGIKAIIRLCNGSPKSESTKFANVLTRISWSSFLTRANPTQIVSAVITYFPNLARSSNSCVFSSSETISIICAHACATVMYLGGSYISLPRIKFSTLFSLTFISSKQSVCKPRRRFSAALSK
jgi:hypothetical protein